MGISDLGKSIVDGPQRTKCEPGTRTDGDVSGNRDVRTLCAEKASRFRSGLLSDEYNDILREFIGINHLAR